MTLDSPTASSPRRVSIGDPLPRRIGRRSRPSPHTFALRTAAGLLVLTVGITAVVLQRLAWREASLLAARERLLAGAPEEAMAAAEPLTRWPALPDHVACVRSLAAALGAAGPGDTAPPPADARKALAAAAVLEAAATRAIAAYSPAALARIARLATAWNHPLAPLWSAALALEAGDPQPAQRLAADAPALLSARGLGLRVREVLSARSAGAILLVRDHSDRLVGWRDATGTFALAPSIPPDLLPVALLDVVASAPAPTATSDTLRVTVDLELSRLALGALGTLRGTIVLVDPSNGDILAAVSDERSLRKWATPALEQQREPASIAKLITTAAALRAGLDPDRIIAEQPCQGSQRYEGGTLWCPHDGHNSGVDEAMARSCNTAFANLGLAVGRAALLDEFRLWGFDAPPGSLLGAAGHVVSPSGTERQLADLAIGLEATQITPLHAALLPTVVSDGGRMPEPSFVAGTEGPAGLARWPAPPREPRSVVDPRFVPVLRRAMEAVALYGTGAGVAPLGFPMAMKTGTAAEWGGGYHVNYVGLAPMPQPRYAFCVRLTHASSSHVVGRNARMVLHDLLEALAGRHDEQLALAAPNTP